MGRTLRFRISRVIKSSFQLCRSKQPLTLSPLPQPPPPSSFSFTQHVASAFTSLGCGCGCGCGCGRNPNHRIKPQEFMWQKQEDEWHIIPKQLSTHNYEDSDHSSSPRHKIYNSSVSNDDDTTDHDCILPPTPPPPKKANKKRRTQKKKTTTNIKQKQQQYRVSTSSADSGLTNIFSSEERELVREETETLVSSSRSFSTDSSTDFNPQLETIRETSTFTRRSKRTSTKKKKKMITKKSQRRTSVSSGSESPARVSVLKKLWRVEVGKVRGSRAVVKKSEDPYGDFKKSMMEMICEKDMYEETDLEQLLHCFLSLNSPQHHPTIIHAFSEIWNAFFSPTTL